MFFEISTLHVHDSHDYYIDLLLNNFDALTSFDFLTFFIFVFYMLGSAGKTEPFNNADVTQADHLKLYRGLGCGYRCCLKQAL